MNKIDTAPRDGTLFDIERDGIPFLDCYFNECGQLVREHGYPSMTRVFDMAPEWMALTTWTSRPATRIKPYDTAPNCGSVYIP